VERSVTRRCVGKSLGLVVEVGDMLAWKVNLVPRFSMQSEFDDADEDDDASGWSFMEDASGCGCGCESIVTFGMKEDHWGYVDVSRMMSNMKLAGALMVVEPVRTRMVELEGTRGVVTPVGGGHDGVSAAILNSALGVGGRCVVFVLQRLCIDGTEIMAYVRGGGNVMRV
jgi:hypothetical protein